MADIYQSEHSGRTLDQAITNVKKLSQRITDAENNISDIQTGKADKTEIPTNIDGLLRENEGIVWCGNTDPQDIGYSIWLDKQIIKVQDSDGSWVDAMAGKADITWIDIEVDASATDLKGSSGYPEKLDTIADDGFYGIRVYQILHGGEGGNEEIHYSLYNEYLIVSKGESGVAQMYIDADKGIRIRNGKKKSDGTITWEMWNQQFDYVDKTTEQDIYGTKNFMEDIRVAGVSGVNVDLPITGEYSLNLTANSGNVNINAKNGAGNVNINGSVLAQDGIATASVTSLDGHLELMSDDMDITAGGQICMNGSTGISINCPGDIRIESKNSSVNLKGDVQVDGMLVLLDTVGGAVSLSAGEIGSLPILFDENATNLVAVIQNLQAQVVALTQRVTVLETVNQDLENIIALQQSYIGGDEA